MIPNNYSEKSAHIPAQHITRSALDSATARNAPALLERARDIRTIQERLGQFQIAVDSLAGQVGTGAALGPGSIGWQLAAVDGEHDLLVECRTT